MSKLFRLHQVRILLTALISSVFVFGNTQVSHAQDASLGTIIYTNSAYSPIEVIVKVSNQESPKSPIHSSSIIKVELLCRIKGSDLPKTASTRNGKILNLGPEWSLSCGAELSQNDGFGKTFNWDRLDQWGNLDATSDETFILTKVATLRLIGTEPVKLFTYASAEDSSYQTSLDTLIQGDEVVLIEGIKPFSSDKISSSKASKTPAPVKTKTKPSTSKVVKDGASCASAGKITNVSGVNLVCAKIGSKLVWVSLSSSGAKATPNPKPTPVASQSKSCSPNSSLVKSYIGADNSQGENLTALVFENLSECNLSVSAIASFICPDGGTLKPQNAIQSTGTFALGSKQKLLITQLSLSRYFPLLSQQCFQLTGFKTNIPPIDTFYGGSPRATVISSTP